MGKLSHLLALSQFCCQMSCVPLWHLAIVICSAGSSTHVTAHLPAWHFSMPSRLASGSRYVPLSRTYFINGQVNK